MAHQPTMILSFRSSRAQGLAHCNQCGECCRNPCQLAGPDEVSAIANYLGRPPGEILDSLVVWKDGDQIRVNPVRGPDGYCVYYAGAGICSIHDVKPSGGRAFECWTDNPHDFTWTTEQLSELVSV